MVGLRCFLRVCSIRNQK